MTDYRTDRDAVRRWPDDSAARAALEEFFVRASEQDSVPTLGGSDLDFRGADLSGLHLGGAWFANADLRGVALRESWLEGCTFSEADLRGADFTGSRLRKADLSDCQAAEAVLRGAHLQRCDLDSADLRGADLTDADCRNAFMPDVDLRSAVLRSVKFDGAESYTDLGGTRIFGATVDGASGRIAGPLDVGESQPRLVAGAVLQAWLAAHGAQIEVVGAGPDHD
ncbi:hypothetical protein GTV32_15065 [Gordonia sp. SID5947]|uniref:pentapeptide repeat-containing protein n=1 Tax=Gordonia sp. SID5947 TaxID=2690315 RepID=UPI001370B5FC|nr:hypothetical protein [Gordonia sp. SID5947]